MANVGFKCAGCGIPLDGYVNYCSWECNIDLAKREGGVTIAPNNLPINCIRWDNTMLEHEHADHVTYQFPVYTQYIGELDDEMHSFEYWDQNHALIYTDGTIALTLYECCYETWSLKTCKPLSKRIFSKDWQLSNESIKKINRLFIRGEI